MTQEIIHEVTQQRNRWMHGDGGGRLASVVAVGAKHKSRFRTRAVQRQPRQADLCWRLGDFPV